LEERDLGPLKPETLDVTVIPSKNIGDIQKIVSGFTYSFYVILLGRDEDEFLKTYVAQNWTNLHYMSGQSCLFLSIYPPEKLDAEVTDYWSKKLGDDFGKLQEKVPTTGWSYEYARNLSIDYDKLPCLFIGVGLNEQTGFVVKIPEILKDDLTSYFQFVFQRIVECSKLHEGDRLPALEKRIDKYYKARLTKIYVKNHWMDYVHPKAVLSTVISQLLSMIPGFPKKGS